MGKFYEGKVEKELDYVINHGWTRLDLRNCGLTEIPCEVFDKCPELMAIDLGNDDFSENKNMITHIPPEIKKLKKLKRLNLSDNQIFEIHDGLGELKSLTHKC